MIYFIYIIYNKIYAEDALEWWLEHQTFLEEEALYPD